MSDKKPHSDDADNLRKRAEEKAREKAARMPENLEALSSEESRRLLHELRVHQIELEMQNEDLRRAQEELEASRARYFDLYDLAPMGYFTISEKGLILEANLTAAGLLGVERSALLKQPLTRFILIEDQDIYYMHSKQLFETGAPRACELRMLRKDSDSFWARVEATAAWDPDGATLCRAIVSDITERKCAEKDLRESETRLREINSLMAKAEQLAHIGSWKWHFKTGEVEASDGMYRIFGQERETIKGNFLNEVIKTLHPEDMEKALEIAEMVKKENKGWQMEFRIIRPDGEERVVFTEGGVIIHDQNGEAVGIMGALQDVTESRRAEREIKHLSTFPMLNPTPVLELGTNGDVVYANPAALHTIRDLGAELEALLPLDLKEIMQQFAQCGQRQAVRDVVVGHRVFSMNIHFVPEFNTFRIYGVDITDRKRAEAEILKSNQELTALNEQLIAGEEELKAQSEELEVQYQELELAHENLELFNQSLAESERLLQAERDKLKGILDTMKDSVYIADAEYIVQYTNPALEKIFGPAVGRRCYELFHDFSMPCTWCRNLKTLACKPIISEELFAKIGRTFDILITPLKNPDGSVSTLKVMHDITRKKQMENEIKESLAFLRTLMDTIPNPIYYKDANGVYEGCNKAFEEYLGMPETEIAGKTLFDVAPHDLAVQYSEKDRELFERKENQVYEGKFVHADGTARDVIISKAPIFRADGGLGGLVGVIVDITDRKKIERALLDSENRLRTFFEASGDAIFIVDTEGGNFQEVNHEAVERLGYTREELFRMRLGDIDIPEFAAQMPERMKQIIETGAAVFETAHVARDGSVIPTEVNVRLISYGGKRMVMGMARDITERKRAEAELAGYRQHLEDLVRERTLELEQAQEKLLTSERLAVIGRLSGSIAHEIRNPLGVISSSAYFIKRTLKTDDVKIKEHLERIKRQVEQCTSIIVSILNLTRMEAPRLHSLDLVQGIKKMAALADGVQNVILELNLPQAPVHVKADREQLGMAVRNMVRNAEQAMPESGTLAIDLERIEREGRPWVRVRFTDAGPGIEPEDRERVFQPLYTTKAQGIGLGLSIVKLIIEKHGGEIFVESSPGGGASFVVLLPAEEESGLSEE